MKKSILSLFVLICILVSLTGGIPAQNASASSTFDGGDGTEENPYLISTAEQLELIEDLTSFCFKLTNNITISDIYIPSFSGMIDGDGYLVTLTNDTDCFFDKVTDSGTIRNLFVKNRLTGANTYFINENMVQL